jgi:hypothetical protein
MIRLGSLAGYLFEGPRLLAGWSPPARPAVYAVLHRPNAAAERYEVIYVDHADDLSAERFPFRHRRAPAWIKRAGGKWELYVATFDVPGGLPSHRELITRELCAVYRPSCNEAQFEQAWEAHWIGEYTAPTTGPLAEPGSQAKVVRPPDG